MPRTVVQTGAASTAHCCSKNLVATCARTCIALGDLELLSEDLFQAYDDAGIAPVYLDQFETFVLGHDVRTVDPRIAQRLIA